MKLTESDREFFKTLNMTDKDIAYIESLDEEEIKHMFGVAVGNPPYQGDGKQQLYPAFYNLGRYFSQSVNMIFPTGWLAPKNNNGLQAMNTKEVKEDKQIQSITVLDDVFNYVSVPEVNVILWRHGYDNGLHGKQLIVHDRNKAEVQLLHDKKDIKKPQEIIDLANLVKTNSDFVSLQTTTSVRKPYGLSTDVVGNEQKYNLPPLFDKKKSASDIAVLARVVGRGQVYMYASADYPFPKESDNLTKYKVFVPYAWGGWDEREYLGGTFANITVGYPNVACTETWLESGSFDDKDTVNKHAKYLFTKFARALLYLNKFSQHSTTAWGAIPQQTYTEDWWDTDDLDELDEHLFDKYKVPENIREFVRTRIQPRTTANIIEL